MCPGFLPYMHMHEAVSSMSRRNATFWSKVVEMGVGETGVGEQGIMYLVCNRTRTSCSFGIVCSYFSYYQSLAPPIYTSPEAESLGVV